MTFCQFDSLLDGSIAKAVGVDQSPVDPDGGLFAIPKQ